MTIGYSRVADEEEFEEGDEGGLDYFMQRHAAAFNAALNGVNLSANGGAGAGSGIGTGTGTAGGTNTVVNASTAMLAIRERVSELTQNLNMLNANEAGNLSAQMHMHLNELEVAAAGGGGGGAHVSRIRGDGTMAANMGLIGSPVREDSVGSRRGIAATTTTAIGSNSGTSDRLQRLNAGKENHQGNSHKLPNSADDIFSEILGTAIPWNCSLRFPPVLIGQYTAKRRHDLDKQEVLTQVSELELGDILPILASCEFALCVYYARAILLRVLKMYMYTAENARDSGAGEKIVNIFDIRVSSKQLDNYEYSRSANGRLEALLADSIVSSGCAVTCEYLKACFKQFVVTNTYQPDRLLPHLCNGNSSGDPIERLPPLAPFSSDTMSELNISLSQLELKMFSDLTQSLSVEESSMQPLSCLSAYLDFCIIKATDGFQLGVKEAISPVCLDEPDRNTSSSSISTGFVDFQDQVLRGVGVDLNSRNENVKYRGDSTKLASSCRFFLSYLINHCLQAFEMAVLTKSEGQVDWISAGLERDDYVSASSQLNMPSGFPSSSVSYSSKFHEDSRSGSTPYDCLPVETQWQFQQLEHQANLCHKGPPVLWAHWVLRHIATRSFAAIALHSNRVANAAMKRQWAVTLEDAPNSSSTGDGPDLVESIRAALKTAEDCLTMSHAEESLTALQTMERLLGMICATDNASIIILLYDVFATVLAAVNVYLKIALSYALSSSESGSENDELDDRVTRKVADMKEFVSLIERECKLLQQFSVVIKSEGLLCGRGLAHRFTRSICGFLFQSYQLNRQLEVFDCVREKSDATAREARVVFREYLRSGYSSAFRPFPEDLALAPGPGPTPVVDLRVIQLSSSSITMSWKLDQTYFEEKLCERGSGCSLFIAIAGSALEEEPILIASSIDPIGSFRIDDLEAGRYCSNPTPLPLNLNLTIFRFYRHVVSNIDQKTLSRRQRQYSLRLQRRRLHLRRHRVRGALSLRSRKHVPEHLSLWQWQSDDKEQCQ